MYILILGQTGMKRRDVIMIEKGAMTEIGIEGTTNLKEVITIYFGIKEAHFNNALYY